VEHLVTAEVHLAEVGARVTLCGKGDRRGPTTPYRSTTAPARIPGVEVLCPECVVALATTPPPP
jgi:hypothetical protein